jgi:hypothetical protein
MLIVIMPGEFINKQLQCVSNTEVKHDDHRFKDDMSWKQLTQ